jgi:4-amino-4-deoxy-L-arabinose transferase-like glycosyltransferase
MRKIQDLFNKFLESKRAFWVALVLVFVLVRMAVWFYPYDSDHWIFYYVGRIIASGQLLYVDAWDHKPPLIFEFNAFMHLVFGGNLILHRIFLTALTILDIFLFYKLANIFTKEFFKKNSEKVAKVALLLYVFWRNLAQFASSGNNTENIGLIFLLLMFLAFFKFYSSVIPAKAGIQKDNGIDSRLRGNDKLYLFLSGVCLSVLFYLKPNFSLLSLPILIEIFLLSYKSIKRFIINYFVFGIPFILQTAFWVLYFNSQNALKDLWVASFAFSSAYAKSAWGGNVSPQSIFIFIMLPLLIPFAIFTINFLRDFKKIKTNMNYRFLLFALVSALFIGFGIGSFYPYYFLISMPTFILIFSYGGKIFLEIAKPKNFVIVLILLGGMAVSLVMSTKQLLNSFSGPVKAELNEYQQIAGYVRASSDKKDKIVAYTYGAVLYRMAERDSGSRFISASVLLLDERDNYGFNLSQTFIDDLGKSKPKYWIISKDEESLYYQNKKIILYMLNNYAPEQEFDNYTVWKNKDFCKN